MFENWKDKLLYSNYYHATDGYYYCSIHKCKIVSKNKKWFCEECNDYTKSRTKAQLEAEANKKGN